MTDTHDTDDTNATDEQYDRTDQSIDATDDSQNAPTASEDGADGSIVSSRRSVLAATFGIPVVASVGVGAADTVRRMADSSMASADANGSAAADVTVDFVSGRHPIDDDQYTQITLDPELLDDLELSVGEQVLLERGDDDRAVYTVAAAMTEADASTIRMNRRARARLDLENTAWAQVGDYGTGCPELLGMSDLVDETFDATASASVVTHDDASAAESAGGLAEATADGGTELAVLAPHGGDVEPHTDSIAEGIHDATSAASSAWIARGYADDGAFLRWHVPSHAIDPAAYPALEATLEDDYDYAVSVHGICTNEIRVGGGASEDVKQEIADAINYYLPASASRAEVTHGRFSAQDPDVLANQASDEGIWLGLTKAARDDHADAIVDAVASAFDRPA